jgi:sterol desaturase/sphingolipid hydroxylase (fatty acid hydroxylase superfamily)
LFHGLGKKGNSVFAFHIRGHHLTARGNGFLDYKVSSNEAIGLPFLLLIHLPAYFLAPAFFYALAIYAVAFLALHNIMHRYPELTKKYFHWHWDHHMSNQNKSWGVVLPLTDLVAGTLENSLDSRS